MKTIDSIKNFGRKALVSGLVLSELVIGCGSREREDKIIVNQKLDNNYSIKVIANVKSLASDRYQFIMTDSSGNKVIEIGNIAWTANLRIKQNDGYTLNIWNGEIKYIKTEEDSTK